VQTQTINPYSTNGECLQTHTIYCCSLYGMLPLPYVCTVVTQVVHAFNIKSVPTQKTNLLLVPRLMFPHPNYLSFLLTTYCLYIGTCMCCSTKCGTLFQHNTVCKPKIITLSVPGFMFSNPNYVSLSPQNLLSPYRYVHVLLHK
jgi:hypothetical protein